MFIIQCLKKYVTKFKKSNMSMTSPADVLSKEDTI